MGKLKRSHLKNQKKIVGVPYVKHNDLANMLMEDQKGNPFIGL
jgi:hypothetical protein